MDQITRAGTTEILQHTSPHMVKHLPAFYLQNWGKKKKTPRERKMKLGLLDPPNGALVPRIKD